MLYVVSTLAAGAAKRPSSSSTSAERTCACLRSRLSMVVVQIRQPRILSQPLAQRRLADGEQLGVEKGAGGHDLAPQALHAAVALRRGSVVGVHGVRHAGVGVQLQRAPDKALNRGHGIGQHGRTVGQMALVLLQTGQIGGDAGASASHASTVGKTLGAFQVYLGSMSL